MDEEGKDRKLDLDAVAAYVKSILTKCLIL